MKTYIHTKTCAQRFTKALFVRAKQTKWLIPGEWINQLHYVYIMKHNSEMRNRYTQLGWISRASYAKKKKGSLKGYTLQNCIYVKFSKERNHRDGRQSNRCQGSGIEKVARNSYGMVQEDFCASRIVLSLDPSGGTWIYIQAIKWHRIILIPWSVSILHLQREKLDKEYMYPSL